MRKPSETAVDAQHRLRRIEGRHNPLVKQLRQAFSRAELTESGDCAIEGLRILEEAIRSGLRFSAVFFRESAQDRAERLLPQIGAPGRNFAAARQVIRQPCAQRIAPGRGCAGAPQGILARRCHGERAAAGRPDCCTSGTAGSRQPGNDSAFLRGLWKRRRGAWRRHCQPVQLESCSRFGGIGVSPACNSRAWKIIDNKAGGSFRERCEHKACV